MSDVDDRTAKRRVLLADVVRARVRTHVMLNVARDFLKTRFGLDSGASHG
jgi:hypothetical protein